MKKLRLQILLTATFLFAPSLVLSTKIFKALFFLKSAEPFFFALAAFFLDAVVVIFWHYSWILSVAVLGLRMAPSISCSGNGMS